MTYRQLLESLQKYAADNPGAEALDKRVVMRVLDRDDDLHVGGLSSISIDAGCGDFEALILDADQTSDDDAADGDDE